MSQKFKARNPEGLYFITTTIVDWVDLFTRPTYKHIIVDSLNYCVAHKGLKIHAWVLMSNHIHLIASCENDLASVMRDFKSFTSKQFSKAIDTAEESRKDWLFGKFRFAANRDLRSKDFTLCTEIPIKIKKKNYKYISIPNYERSRLGGKKKVNEFIDGLLILISFIKFFFIKND